MIHHATRRTRLLALAAALIIGAFGATPAVAQTATPATEASTLAGKLDRARAMLAAHQDSSGVAGLSAAIAVDGRLVWAGGFGYADLQNRVPAGPEMVSRIGSISKPVAAVAAMALWDRGLLDLDAPISTYLPQYPAEHAHITMRQLMSHTAGVRHYNGDEFMSNLWYPDVVTPLEVFWADSLLFEPGTDFSYTTYGWTVVSAVTQGADDRGRSWVRILDDEVVGPLGLTTLQPEWQDSVIPHHARFYERDSTGVYLNAPEVDLSNKWAGGGLVATAGDLVNFALGVLHGDVLSDSARAEMWTRQTAEDDPSYGLGWFLGEVGGHRMVNHAGGSMGATAMLILVPDHDIAVAILGNTGGVGHGGIAANVARLFVDG